MGWQTLFTKPNWADAKQMHPSFITAPQALEEQARHYAGSLLGIGRFQLQILPNAGGRQETGFTIINAGEIG